MTEYGRATAVHLKPGLSFFNRLREIIMQTTMKVWDVLFTWAKVLFNIALAVFMVTFIRLLAYSYFQGLTWFSRFSMVMLMSQMKEEELMMTHHIRDAIKIIQNTIYHLFDPHDLWLGQVTAKESIEVYERR
ncbi:hypothetical protein L1987_48816 [Smallanthus sonchifolius]|uniref:Uncharacterized protein n=1 Tax=Smallanthus sonchifolius TaxID=185202 RepID=A0ACB9FTL6_9ASTR|nr:hypothetical protein L1987_48816 [Smallanthus sonchifolius]